MRGATPPSPCCRVAWEAAAQTEPSSDSGSAAVGRALWLGVVDRACAASAHRSVGLYRLADTAHRFHRPRRSELGCRSRRNSSTDGSRAGRGENFDHYVLFADGTHLIRLPSNIKIIARPNHDQLASGVVAVWAGVVEINQRSRVIRGANRRSPRRCGSPLCHCASNQPGRDRQHHRGSPA